MVTFFEDFLFWKFSKRFMKCLKLNNSGEIRIVFFVASRIGTHLISRKVNLKKTICFLLVSIGVRIKYFRYISFSVKCQNFCLLGSSPDPFATVSLLLNCHAAVEHFVSGDLNTSLLSVPPTQVHSRCP